MMTLPEKIKDGRNERDGIDELVAGKKRRADFAENRADGTGVFRLVLQKRSKKERCKSVFRKPSFAMFGDRLACAS
jgi:hypothetical protein